MNKGQGAAVYKPPTHKIGDFKSPLLVFPFSVFARD